jgi:diacylglycerol kinase family enzyme
MALVGLIFNPLSGRGGAEAMSERIVDVLERRGFEVLTGVPGDLPEMRPDHLIVVGGDGTVRWVLEDAHRRWCGAVPDMLVIARGTANLLSHHLGRVTHLAGIPELLQSGHRRDIDVADVNGQLMLLMCGIGFDGAVVHEVVARRKGPITKLSYVMPALRTLLRPPTLEITVHADDRNVFGPAPASVIVANVREYGAGFPLAPDARSDDQLLDVTILPGATRAASVGFTLAAAARRLGRSRAIRLRASRVKVAGVAPVQVDGEAMGNLPVEIGLRPWRARFIVPGS